MDEKELAAKSFQLIKRDFRLEEQFDAGVEKPFDRLHLLLIEVVKYLLDKDFASLMNALYRIDVSEEKVKEILELSQPEELASNLASAIILRERQKVETRLKYSS